MTITVPTTEAPRPVQDLLRDAEMTAVKFAEAARLHAYALDDFSEISGEIVAESDPAKYDEVRARRDEAMVKRDKAEAAVQEQRKELTRLFDALEREVARIHETYTRGGAA